MIEARVFYVVQYGVRKIKYLGGNYDRFAKVDSVHVAEKFDVKEVAEKYLGIFEKGRVVTIRAEYIVGE